MMSQPVQLSDELVREARETCTSVAQSPAEQIERWARLGRAFEPLLYGGTASPPISQAMPLSECLETVETDEGRRRLADYLNRRPFPHYQPIAGEPGLFVRTDTDGNRTTGRFIDGHFEAVD